MCWSTGKHNAWVRHWKRSTGLIGLQALNASCSIWSKWSIACVDKNFCLLIRFCVSGVPNSEQRGAVVCFGWLYNIVLCFVAIPSSNIHNFFPKLTCLMIRWTVYSYAVSFIVLICFGWACLDIRLHLLCVCISILTKAVCCRSLADVRIPRSIEIVLGMPPSSTVRVCSCIDISPTGPSARVSDSLYVVFTIAFAECGFPVDSGS